MLTLYTAVGILRFQDSIKEHKTPTVINNRQGIRTDRRRILSVEQPRIYKSRQIHELQSAFSERLEKTSPFGKYSH